MRCYLNYHKYNIKVLKNIAIAKQCYSRRYIVDVPLTSDLCLLGSKALGLGIYQSNGPDP